MIQIIPAIDIIDGKCVRLVQGDYGNCTTYSSTPLDMAKLYADCGIKRIHVVDLDGAKSSSPKNLGILEKISFGTTLEIEWGGGIKTRESLKSVLNAGADYAIIGSIAASKPHLFAHWLEEFGGGQLILGADIRDGKVSVNGWKEDTTMGIEDVIEEFLPHGLTQVICTDISRDGMLEGPSYSLYNGLQEKYKKMEITVSGGISSMEDIIKLDALGLKKVIVGKAIYENRISLKELKKWLQRG